MVGGGSADGGKQTPTDFGTVVLSSPEVGHGFRFRIGRSIRRPGQRLRFGLRATAPTSGDAEAGFRVGRRGPSSTRLLVDFSLDGEGR